jgi:hypothetical protein
LQRTRHTPPKLPTLACLHHTTPTPLPLQSCTSLPAPLEGDIPTFPARAPPPWRSTGTRTPLCPSMRAEPHRSKQATSTPSTAAEPHTHAAVATDEDAAEALLGEVAGAGDSDRADALMERALVDGRLDAIETMRNMWCAPAMEVDLPPGLASTSAIGFSWRSDLLPRFVAVAFAPRRTGASTRRRRWRPWHGAGTRRRPASRWPPLSGAARWCGATAVDIRRRQRMKWVTSSIGDSLRYEKYSSRYLQQHMTVPLLT